MQTYMNKKITFVTYHNWETKRHGGFHQFAKYVAQKGNEVVFFSFSRPYYSVLKHDERLNATIWRKLCRGVSYKVGKGILHNVTWPTFAIPGNLRDHLPVKVCKWFMTHSLTPFGQFQKKWIEGSDCFVFESCDALHMLDKISRYNPNAKIVYRPSDPVVDISNEKALVEAEHQMLLKADKIILVNEESREVYKEAFKDYDDSKSIVISNGVEISDYKKIYPVPPIMEGKKTALFIGLFDMEWDLIVEAAIKLPEITFIVVNPNHLQKDIEDKIKGFDNIVYVPGIKPSEVPQWVTNANLIMQPHPKNVFSNKRSLSLTAKNYKAMAAGKPIVAYMIPKKLERYGLIVAENYNEFIEAVKENIDNKDFKYKIDLSEKDWDYLCDKFLKVIGY